MDSIGAWTFYGDPKPKKGRYRRVLRKSFADFGSWAFRHRKPRKGTYRPVHR